jgi:hypothetical protein
MQRPPSSRAPLSGFAPISEPPKSLSGFTPFDEVPESKPGAHDERVLFSMKAGPFDVVCTNIFSDGNHTFDVYRDVVPGDSMIGVRNGKKRVAEGILVTPTKYASTTLKDPTEKRSLLPKELTISLFNGCTRVEYGYIDPRHPK